jgi:hypothetical protein
MIAWFDEAFLFFSKSNNVSCVVFELFFSLENISYMLRGEYWMLHYDCS